MKSSEKILREYVRAAIIKEAGSFSDVLGMMNTALPTVTALMNQFQAESDEEEADDDVIEEEIGRNHHTLDNNPFSWKDVDGIDVTTYASSDGNWSAKVECDDYPDMNTGLRSFSDEAEAEHWARMVADKMFRKMINKK